MNDKTKRVLAGWLSLSSAEREDLDRELRRLHGKSSRELEDERKSIRLTTGPLAEGCPCCGR